MTSPVRIVLEGLPERVQAIADALEQAVPEAFEWHDLASFTGEADIVLKGSVSRENDVMAFNGRRTGLLAAS